MEIRQDVRHAFRMWRRTPGFIVIVVATLAIGIGANTAMFSILHEALLRPLPFPSPDRLVLVDTTFSGEINPVTSFPDFYDYRDQNSTMESVAATSPGAMQLIVTGQQKPEFAPWMYVSWNWFDTLKAAPAAGRWFRPDEGKTGAPYVAVVSDGYARRRFGSAQKAVGQPLTLSGIAKQTVSATIIGVAPRSARLLADTDMWMPMRQGEEDGPETRRFHNWQLVARMKPGVAMEQAQAEANTIAARLRSQYPETNIQKGFTLEPLQAGMLRSQTPSMFLLMGAVGLVLLIACANVAGLLLARGALRRQELAIRTALGASRRRIVTQLLIESMLLATLAGGFGVALAFWLQRLLPIAVGLARSGVTPTGLHWPVLLFALVVSMLTGLLFGLVPALRASVLNPGEHLAHGVRTTGSRGGQRLRAALVVGQVALSLVLLVSAGLLIRSFAQLANTNLGFHTEHLLTGEIQLPNTAYPPERRFQFFDSLREELAAIPGVTGVGFIDKLPIKNPWGNYPLWATSRPPADPSLERSANVRLVLPGYLETAGIPLLAGRTIGPSDRKSASTTAVIDERLATTLFPGQNPIGQELTANLGILSPQEPVNCEVVGVVGAARLDTVDDPGHMAIYLSYDQFMPRPSMHFVVRTAVAPETMAASIRKTVATRAPDLPLGPLVTMDQVVSDSLIPQRVTTITLTLFSTIAMLLAALGLYGTLAYWVNQRRQEMGIRVALGAERRDIVRLVVGHGMRLALLGAAIGIAGAFAVTRLMSTMIYGIGAHDPATFAGVVALLVASAAMACLLPAWRATRVNPVETLRSE